MRRAHHSGLFGSKNLASSLPGTREVSLEEFWYYIPINSNIRDVGRAM